MRTRKYPEVAALLAVAMAFAPLRVHAGTMTGAATEWTQVSNNVELLQHTIHLIRSVYQLKKQVEYMALHAKRMRSPADFMAVMGGVAGLLSQLRALLYGSQSLVERWKQTHQGNQDFSEWYSTPADAYQQIDESTRQAVLRSMQALELQANSADGWPKDRTILAELSSQAETADGQLKATQVTNRLLAEVIRQLHLLRGVQIAHAEMMGYAVSGETQRRQFEDKYLRTQRFGYTGRYTAAGPRARGRGDVIGDWLGVAEGAATGATFVAGAFGSSPSDPVDRGLNVASAGAGGAGMVAQAGAQASSNSPPSSQPVDSGFQTVDGQSSGAGLQEGPTPGGVGGGMGDPNWQPVNGPRAPAPGSHGGDENWQPANGPRAPAPGSHGGDETWQPANGPRAPAPGSRGGDETWQPANGPRAPAPDQEEGAKWN